MVTLVLHSQPSTIRASINMDYLTLSPKYKLSPSITLYLHEFVMFRILWRVAGTVTDITNQGSGCPAFNMEMV